MELHNYQHALTVNSMINKELQHQQHHSINSTATHQGNQQQQQQTTDMAAAATGALMSRKMDFFNSLLNKTNKNIEVIAQ